MNVPVRFRLSLLFIFISVLLIVGWHFHARAIWYQDRQTLLEEIKSLQNTASHSDTDALPTVVNNDQNSRPVIDPGQVLSDLLHIESINSTNDVVFKMHGVVYRLGLLVHAGPDGIGPIRQFLNGGEDRNYPLLHVLNEAEQSVGSPDTPANVLGYELWKSHRARYDFAFPPTLRLGLIQAVEAIGGPESESILTELINRTKRGIEVCFAYRALERLAPGKHRALAVRAARNLLDAFPESVPEDGSLRPRENDYLFLVLAECRDSSFAALAQRWLVNDQGHLNRNALEYTLTLLQADAVPLLQTAFGDPRLLDVRERIYLAGLASDYCGMSPSADAFVSSVINDRSLPDIIRTMMVQTLNGFNMVTKKYVPLSENVVRSRIDLLNRLEPASSTDAFLSTPLYAARLVLQGKLASNGVPP